MIESLMLIALGFLLATLFGLIAAQFIWRRAVTVTLRKMNTGEMLATEAPQEQAQEYDLRAEFDALAERHQNEMAPLKAEVGNLKAEGARLAAANEALTREKAQIAAESERLKSEVERLKTGFATLHEEIENAAAETAKHAASVATAQRELSGLEQALSEEAKHYETARAKLAALDTPTPPPARAVQAPEPESDPKDEPQQALEPYTAAEQDADARTLAEVKASLLAELDAPRGTATAEAEDEDEEGGPPLEDPRNAGPSLAERIRALEAGVAH